MILRNSTVVTRNIVSRWNRLLMKTEKITVTKDLGYSGQSYFIRRNWRRLQPGIKRGDGEPRTEKY